MKHIRCFLRSILAEAEAQEYVRRNQARLLRVPATMKVNRPFLTLAEVKRLLRWAMWQRRESALLRLVLVTALRPSELFALRWRDFDSEKSTLSISVSVYRGVLRPYTKTTSEEDNAQRLAIPELASIALSVWSSQTERDGQDDFIFPNADGGFIHRQNYAMRVLKPLGEMAGIERLNWQILRRTVATHAQHLGSPKDIAEIMRHKKVETSQQHYIQAISETVKKTSELLAAKMLAK